jgi:hypothetical protein
MGWQTDDGKHEGWDAAEFPDGRFAVGSENGGAMVRSIGPGLDADAGRGVLDGRTAIGWRGLCTCGWRGHLWRKVTGDISNGPPQEVLDKMAARGMRELTAHEAYDPDPSVYGDAPAGLEDEIWREWHGHLPPQSLADVREAALAVAGAQLQLDEAVRRARGDSCSWADIGDAAGITRQSAHERWGRR